MTESVEKANNTEPSQPPKGKKSKILYRTLLASALFLALSGAALVPILATESGNKWAIQLAEKFVSGLSVGSVSGKLGTGLTLNQLKFQSAGVNTELAQAQLQLDFSCLWKADICIPNIALKQANIEIDSSQLPPTQPQPTQPSKMQRISLPLGISLSNLVVEDLSLKIDQNQLKLGQFSTAVELNNDSGLTISPTQINDLSYVTHSSTKTAPAKTEPSQPIDWQALAQNLRAPLLSNLQQFVLPLELHIADMQGKNWQYQQFLDGKLNQQIQIPSWQIAADATVDKFQLQKLSIQSSLGDLQGQGELQLSQDFPVDFQLHSNIQPIIQNKQILLAKSKLALALRGSLQKSTAVELKIQGGLQANLTGDVQLSAAQTPFNLHLSIQNLRYPAQPNADSLKLQGVDLTAQGNLLDYQAQLKGQVEGMGVPKTQLQLQTQGGISQLKINQLQLNALNGSLNLQGDLAWRNGLSWQTAVVLDKINLANYLKDFPALLSGNFSNSGQIEGKNWQIQVPQLALQGSLSQREIKLTGAFSSDQTNWFNSAGLSLNYGNNHLDLSGNLAPQQSDLKLNIDAPNLQGLFANLSANLKGQAHFRGKFTAPELDLNLNASHFQFAELKIAKLSAKSKLQTEQQISGNLNLELQGLSQGEIKIQQAKLQAGGDEKSHQLQLRSSGDPLAADFNLSGSFDRNLQRWQATLSQVAIATSVGAVKNNQNIQISFDYPQTQAQISAHCWLQTELNLCFPQAFHAGKTGEIPFELKSLDLELVNKLLQQPELLHGKLRSQGKLSWTENAPLNLNISVAGDKLRLQQKLNYRPFQLVLDKLNVDAQLADNNLSSKTLLQLPNQGRAQMELNIQDLLNSRKLSGALSLQQLNLNLLNQILANEENVAGNISANLNFAGNLQNPSLQGKLKIQQIQAKLYASPVEIKQGDLQLNFEGSSSRLHANLTSVENSQLKLEGSANWQNPAQWQAELRAKATDFALNIPDMARLKLSPDVSLKASANLLQLKGNVQIPWARIEIDKLPDSAVKVSDDEVILDATAVQKRRVLPNSQLPANTKSGMKIQSDLQITLGQDVHIDAYGLQSKLEGMLSIQQQQGNLGLFGEIQLKKGRYNSFGQDLLIRKGQINFSGLPSQPLLNIEAIRNPEAMESASVTAGVRVTGVADAPNIAVFTSPAMSQDQALSYLLTGRSLENSGQAGSSGSVGAALLGLGLSKSGKVMSDIGKAFGIQDLNLGTAGVGDSSKVVVSGNITPRLKIKYGVGLFDGLAEVTVRYRLMPQLFLQSVSSINQAFDLLYEFEF